MGLWREELENGEEEDRPATFADLALTIVIAGGINEGGLLLPPPLLSVATRQLASCFGAAHPSEKNISNQNSVLLSFFKSASQPRMLPAHTVHHSRVTGSQHASTALT
jgi:hypothetical protein